MLPRVHKYFVEKRLALVKKKTSRSLPWQTLQQIELHATIVSRKNSALITINIPISPKTGAP